MKPSARLFYCARCHCQVVICRHCDRGNVYCPAGCAQIARIDSQRRAVRRYSKTRRGRHSNAERQRRFRALQRHPQEKVTHQGSLSVSVFALLLIASMRRERQRVHPPLRTERALHCHVCHCECDPFLRRDFLRRSTRRKSRRRLYRHRLMEGDDA